MKFNIDTKIFKSINYYASLDTKGRCTEIPPCEIEERDKRIIVIGDIHGDFYSLLHALYKGGVINNNGEWIGRKTIVVQLGDQLDKGGRGVLSDPVNDSLEELKVIEYMHHLHTKAKRSGGAVYNLIGNHELMNIMGDFRYATNNHINGFGGEESRRRLFRPGGPLAKKLACNTNGVLRIGDWIFVHAGLLPRHVEKYGISEINQIVRDILLGGINLNNMPHDIKELVMGSDSIFWTRNYSMDNNSCQSVHKTLEILKIGPTGGMVVGHTVQDKINAACNNKLWMADVGMSSAFGEKASHAERVQILEILGNGKHINTL